MRVLLVAPRTGLLLVEEEVEDITRSGLTVDLMLGSVTSLDLIRRLKQREYDVLWLATHGDKDGVLLSDGLFSASELVPQVRDRFSLVVLNSCSSLAVAQLLQEEANVSVICTLLEVPDRQAYQTGSRLASALGETNNLAVAYRASKPGNNRSYLYLATLTPSQDSIDSLIGEIRELRTQLTAIGTSASKDRMVARWAIGTLAVLQPLSWLIWYVTLGRFVVSLF